MKRKFVGGDSLLTDETTERLQQASGSGRLAGPARSMKLVAARTTDGGSTALNITPETA